MLDEPVFYLAVIACLVTLGILAVGIAGFARGGAFNRKYANKIMRLRILAQAIAVLLILLLIGIAGGRG